MFRLGVFVAVLVLGVSTTTVRAGAGDLDPSFGDGGIVTTPIGFIGLAYGLAIQPDGKLVASGQTQASNGSVYSLSLARYDTNGSLDATFGVKAGRISTPGIGRSDVSAAV